jgi:manganese/zinc/iron transport system permease protein
LVKEDAAIGLVFPALFALGVILVTYHARNLHIDVDAVLFGTPELAPLHRLSTDSYDFGPMSLAVMTGIFLLNAALVTLFFKELKLSTFDAALAASLGFAPAILHYVLMGLVSLTAVTAFDAVGPVLVVAFFVVPAATAYLVTDRLSVMVVLGVCFAIIGALIGTVVAYRLGVTISGTVAVVMGLGFCIAFIASPRHGLVTLVLHRVRQRREFFDTMLAIHLLQHEGTPDEAVECRLATLHSHMNWPGPQTLIVVARVTERGWATLRDERLVLTPEGRRVASSALHGPSSPESVS